MTSNRFGLWISAVLAAGLVTYSANALACGDAKAGCGCKKAPVGVELPKDYPQGEAACPHMKDGKGGGCGCGAAKQGQEPKLKVPDKKAELFKPVKEVRAGFTI